MKLLFKITGIIVLVALSFSNLNAQGVADTTNTVFRDFKTEMVWEAKVKIGQMINVGESKRGVRRVIPILGGTFKGPEIEGTILPMGEDWQLVRPDGDTELYARYLLKTDDGHIIHVLNKALISEGGENNEFYSKSVLDLEAPVNSPYEFLNHSVFIGTLGFPELKQGEDPYVIIGVYKLLQ